MLIAERNGIYVHWCAGCKELHEFHVGKARSNGARWTFNGNTTSPTFSRSMNIRIGPYYKDGKLFTDVCHYFIVNGQIQYCGDTTHCLSGQTLDLEQIPYEEKLLNIKLSYLDDFA